MHSKIVIAGLLTVAAAFPQSLQFTLLPPGATKPTARFDGPIAYDPRTRQVYLFGGQADTAQNDLWSYSIGSQSWSAIAIEDAKPPARFGHTLILDPVRNRLIAFAGQAGGFFSDTWAFDLGAKTWSRLSGDDAGPKRRYGHSAIYDPVRDRMIISHGFTDSGRFDDTWAFDFGKNAWQDISPASGRPLRRCLHHAAYDPKRDRMFLYGGCSSGFGPCPQDDLWTFDLQSNQWTQRASTPRPPGRERYGMAFDNRRDRLLVFAGGGNAGLLNDTWEYDPAAQTWATASITAAVPEPRNRLESVLAEDLGAVVFFGGVTSGGLSNELWMLGGAQAGGASDRPVFSAGSVVNGFSGFASGLAPGEIVSIFGAGLGPAVGIATSFDATNGKLPTQVAGVSVTFNGVPAPIYYARADQLNVQAPYELAGAANASLGITYQGAVGTPVTVPVRPTHPGILPLVFNQDGSVNSAANPAAAGSVIVLYATGQGVTNPASATGAFPAGTFPAASAAVSITIGGKAAGLQFEGQAPGTAGVLQLNAKLPGRPRPRKRGRDSPLDRRREKPGWRRGVGAVNGLATDLEPPAVNGRRFPGEPDPALA